MTTIIPPPRYRFLPLVALLAAGALALGACASESDSDPAAVGGTEDAVSDTPAVAVEELRATMEQAMERTRAVSSADMSYELEVEGAGQVQRAVLAGEIDSDDVGTVTGEQGADELVIEIRSDGETGWMHAKGAQLEGQLPPGVQWVEASIDDLRDAGIFTGLDETFALLSVLHGVEEGHDAGTEQTGDDTIRLIEGTIDWDAALSAAPAEERAGLEESITVGEDTEIQGVGFTVGLDDQERVRRFELFIEAGPAGTEPGPSGAPLRMTVVFAAARYDHDVEVPEEPPADETVPFDEVPGFMAVFG